MRVAQVIALSDEERATLVRWSRGRSSPARLVRRAKTVRAAAVGREHQDIAAGPGCTRRTAKEWRNLFAEFRLDEQPFYDQIRLDEPWASEHDRQVRGADVPAYQCVIRPSANGQ